MFLLKSGARKVVFSLLCLFFVLNSAIFGQAVRSITVPNALAPVDDDGSQRADLGFRINFFGINYDSVWVNNNGNLTFNASLWTYTPYLIQQNSMPMFATFFADVDTRYYGNVTRYGKGTLQIAPGNVRNIFCINWIDVGCYGCSSNPSVRNTFQMVIIDRSDIAPGDFDLEYNYNQIMWEAGTASGGTSYGLGGTTVSMGWSNGTSTFYSHSGSLEPGALLDNGPKSLIHNRLNSTVDGRYVFFVRNGIVVDLIGPQTFSIRELARPLAFVGRVNTTSIYPRNDISFSIVPPVLSEFTLATDTSGVIRVGAGTRLDYETRNQYTFYAIASVRNTTYRDTALMTINILNVEPEQFLRDTVFTISEMATSGTAVGTIAAPLAPNPRFTLIGVSSDFNLDALGNLTVSPTENLDFETRPQHLLTVIGRYVNSPDTLYDTAVITVNLTDYSVGDLISNQSFTIPEISGPGTAVGTIALNVTPSIVTLSVLGTLPPEFTLDLTTRALVVAPGATLSWEITPVYTFRLIAQAAEAHDDTALITINILNCISGDLISDQAFSIAENSQSGTFVGKVLLNQPDSIPIILTTLPGWPAQFNFNASTRIITVAPGALLDFETINVYTGKLLARTSGANDDTAQITIRLTDVVVPDLVDNQSFTIKENPPSGTRVGTVVLKQAVPVTMSIITCPPQFAFDPLTRIISVAPGAVIDYDALNAYSIKLLARASEALDDTAVISVSIIRNRPPQIQATADTTIREKDTLRLLITATDSDDAVVHITPARGLPAGGWVVDNGNGRAMLYWPSGCNDHGIDTITVRAFDGTDSAFARIIVHVIDVNFPPELDKVHDRNAWLLQPFSLTIHAHDCDGPVTVRAINMPSGAQFWDNGDGTGTMLWTPQINDAGYYMVIFEASDDATSVRDTIIIIVTEPKHLFAPELNVSAHDTSVGINLPVTIFARATVSDGTAPVLSTSLLPPRATFVSDTGNAVFSWIPDTAGVFTFTITASNIINPAWETTDTIRITVENKNVTGPVFIHHADTAIDQNTDMALTVEAKDPDGSIPQLYFVSAPTGVRFVDNGNGTGTFFWKPRCQDLGKFFLKAGATDHYVSDTISVGVDVRAIAFPPSIAPLPDKSAIPGEFVRIPVQATDLCNGGAAPSLSVSCELSGYTFKDNGDGSGTFGWYVTTNTGSFPISFTATNGLASVSRTMVLSINKTGSIIVKAQPVGARIHVMPSMNYAGTFLGCDSLCYTARLGLYWFEVELPGFRSERFAGEIKGDSITTRSIVLKPAIPLMFTGPDSIIADTSISSSYAGAITCADVNEDGLLDVSVISGSGFTTSYGFNNGTDSGFITPDRDSAEVSTPLAYPISHVFSDWKNSGSYSAIISLSSGKVLLLCPSSGRYAVAETLCTVPGSRPFPLVMDANHDGKKDLVVHSEGKGVFVYLNTGSDSAPILSSPKEITDSSGQSLTHFIGAPMLIDMNQTNSPSWVFSCMGVLKLFAVDSSFSMMKYESDLNCAGKICVTDSARFALVGSPFGQPRLVVLKGPAIKVYSTHLCGDVNGDKVVDIRDISRISKLWESVGTDSNWEPICNLKLSGNGVEVIDIRDISRASKCWELQE
jgi:hypothetical protein